jgi:hypothetical protein
MNASNRNLIINDELLINLWRYFSLCVILKVLENWSFILNSYSFACSINTFLLLFRVECTFVRCFFFVLFIDVNIWTYRYQWMIHCDQCSWTCLCFNPITNIYFNLLFYLCSSVIIENLLRIEKFRSSIEIFRWWHCWYSFVKYDKSQSEKNVLFSKGLL